jgi:hypothetical protein
MWRVTQVRFIGLLVVVSLLTSNAFRAVGHNKAHLFKEHAASLSAAKSLSDVSCRSAVESIVLCALAPMNLPFSAEARLEAVNRPDLLPSEKGLNVIQIEKFLTTGQARRMNDMLSSSERDTGFRV